jgi:ABC-2 type transport system permease protein
MNPGRIRALTTRIMRQFRRDPRTLALLFVVPVVILSLLGYIYRGSDDVIELAVRGDVDTPPAAAILEALAREERVRVVQMDLEEIDAALDARDIEGVLTLPSDLSLEPNGGRHVIVHLEGTDPARASRVMNTLGRTLPAVTLQLVTDGEQPLAIDARFLHGGPEFDQLDFLAPVFIGFFAFFFVFLLTSVSFLRERMQGSIERLMVSPVSRPEIVTGYMLGFSVFAAIQSAVIIGFSVLVLDIHQVGSLGYVFLVTLLLTVGAVNLGIFLSTFARTELQVVQFIPVVIVPQGLLSGIIWSVDTLPDPLMWLARVMPLTYANDALRGIMVRGDGLGAIGLELSVLAGFAILMVILSSLTLRREVA